MRRAWIAFVAVLATGCTPMQWVRDDATPEQVAGDFRQCQQAAWQEENTRTMGFSAFSPWISRDAFGRPFMFQPAGPFYDPYSDRYMDEQRLANFCMRAKGYALTPRK
jgi:hypothetical protein